MCEQFIRTGDPAVIVLCKKTAKKVPSTMKE